MNPVGRDKIHLGDPASGGHPPAASESSSKTDEFARSQFKSNKPSPRFYKAMISRLFKHVGLDRIMDMPKSVQKTHWVGLAVLGRIVMKAIKKFFAVISYPFKLLAMQNKYAHLKRMNTEGKAISEEMRREIESDMKKIEETYPQDRSMEKIHARLELLLICEDLTAINVKEASISEDKFGKIQAAVKKINGKIGDDPSVKTVLEKIEEQQQIFIARETIISNGRGAINELQEAIENRLMIGEAKLKEFADLQQALSKFDSPEAKSTRNKLQELLLQHEVVKDPFYKDKLVLLSDSSHSDQSLKSILQDVIAQHSKRLAAAKKSDQELKVRKAEGDKSQYDQEILLFQTLVNMLPKEHANALLANELYYAQTHQGFAHGISEQSRKDVHRNPKVQVNGTTLENQVANDEKSSRAYISRVQELAGVDERTAKVIILFLNQTSREGLMKKAMDSLRQEGKVPLQPISCESPDYPNPPGPPNSDFSVTVEDGVATITINELYQIMGEEDLTGEYLPGTVVIRIPITNDVIEPKEKDNQILLGAEMELTLGEMIKPKAE